MSFSFAKSIIYDIIIANTRSKEVAMSHNDLPDLLAFIKIVELMKVHTRTAWNSEGKKR